MPSTYQTPTHRRLKVFAFDPMLGRLPLHRITLDVPYEPLTPGPRGQRIHVIDFDGARARAKPQDRRRYHPPVDLNDDLLLLQDGLDPSESDPRFHQQMVYAVAMKVLENFDIALGRRFYFRGRKPLRVFPHAFFGANAYYDPRRRAVLFGYFPADQENYGSNLPGQPVYSCLSHDIISHEVTHAITHRMRKHFLEPTNHDVLAFHEAFSDIVAIFQHLSFPEILRHAIQESQGDLRKNTTLIELAAQFGYATGNGNALRSAVDQPEPRRLSKTLEPHERGSVLVAAVFDAFFRTYQDRIQDLLRIASGGTGRLPQGAIHPDLANRLALEAATVAQATLRMCIRAFEYLPPVDVTFGDYLRALVTADFELNPFDGLGLRRAMVEAFRARGIFPERVASLSEDALRWRRVDPNWQDIASADRLDAIIGRLSSELIQEASGTSRNSSLDPPTPDTGLAEEEEEEEEGSTRGTMIYKSLSTWARANAQMLDLVPDKRVQVAGVHPVFRVGRDGQLLVEVVFQLVQSEADTPEDLGGLPLRGGTTVVVQANGRLRYVISKPLPVGQHASGAATRAEARLARQRGFVRDIDEMDSFHVWKDAAFQKHRLQRLMNLARLHAGVRR